MKLYEINQQIAELIDRIDIDCETGEIGESTDEVLKELDALEMERTDILTYLAKLVLNTRSDVAALKAEEARLKERHLHGCRIRRCPRTLGGRHHMGEDTDRLGITHQRRT
ncbi:siphovirus Gp157 family protein [Olegusella massiliensis]|uniref:siphovirus Gp157 family protein n=1 Tax=Olegusella massiliensis TaxID=1776381 RepID=UPI0008381036|nr:siphovirus Gp157 family protein [Olegusella massiliensis]